MKQQYQSPVLAKPPSAPCTGLMYRDFIGRWRCAEPTRYRPCAPGFADGSDTPQVAATPAADSRMRRLLKHKDLESPTSSKAVPGTATAETGTGFGSSSLLNGMTHGPGYCHARCPPWMVDCGGSCHMPGVTCSLQAIYLCPAVPPGGKRCGVLCRVALQAVQADTKMYRVLEDCDQA